MNKLLMILLMILINFTSCTYLPLDDLQIPDGVSVRETSEYIEITPSGGSYSSTGFMFYPGGLVDPHAYIRPLGIFSRKGYKTVIVKMPANLAVLDPDKGLRLKDSFSGIRRWITGGHSVGGTFACNMIARHPDVYQGIVLFAAYPAQSDDLSGWGAPVLSLTAEKDGLSTPAEIEAAKPLLPQAFHYTDPVQAYPVQKGYTLYHEIQGGCHSYFGHYGMQDGDGVPRISEDAQQNEMALYMDTFFTRVAP